MAEEEERRSAWLRLRRSRRVLLDLLWLQEERFRLAVSELQAENARLRRRLRQLSAELRRKSEISR